MQGLATAWIGWDPQQPACGGINADYLPTEQPQITNRQADMLVRTDQDELHHVEFQAFNEAKFPFRMLDYWVYFRREHERPVKQTVFYIGTEPLQMPPFFEENGTRHPFEIVNLQEYDAGELLARPDWGDNLCGLSGREGSVRRYCMLCWRS